MTQSANSHTQLENDEEEQDSVQEFATRFEWSSGIVHQCSAASEIVPTIEQIITERGRGKSCYTKQVLELISEATKNQGQQGEGSDVILSAFQYNPSTGIDGLDILSQVDTGITIADYAIAETGSLVEVSYSDSKKLLSSLSRVNVVLVKRKNILRKLQELAPILRELLSGDKSDKPTVTLIGGPSRTGDIEMKMVLGVHGPHEVHAIIVP